MAILYGTTSEGETLPVLVDQFGNLLAKGIEGPQGPEGPPGIGQLPPGATDGALLGWQDGELVWITEPLPPISVSGFIPIIYTGNGVSQSIDCGFSPDLVWIKESSSTGDHHLFDIVRGATKSLRSNLRDAETIDANELTAFTINGFDLGSGSDVNQSGVQNVAWAWDAGDNTVTNQNGSIESLVRSNGSFSIISFTSSASNGASFSVGHGLSNKPKFALVKTRDSVSLWCVYHASVCDTTTKYLELSSDSSLQDLQVWGDNLPSFDVLELTSGGAVNVNQSCIAYCWAEESGVSNFGSYPGSGSRQTINTGFRPSLVMIKSTGDGNWFMFDNARGSSKALYANEFAAEAETGAVEFLDNGFQLLSALPGVNESNTTYIYAAFANPQDAALAQRQLRREARQEERQQNETQPR